MTDHYDDYDTAMRAALAHSRTWLKGLPTRKVAPTTTADEVRSRATALLTQPPVAPAQVVDELADLVEPGLMAIGSGRFFGWVMGGTLPAALGADWLVSAWDQNAGMRFATPGAVGVEEAAGSALLSLLGLPQTAAVGFTTGGTTANFTALASGRHALLRRAGWDDTARGLAGGPAIRVLAGAERHVSVDLALRYLGLGLPELVDADEQGRIRLDALATALADAPPDTPTLLCLQAGNLHSGGFDAVGEACAVAHRYGAWVHVDGAFGLWAAATPELAHLTAGIGDADSWATDAHKTLNVPYDCGISIVADPAPLRTAMGAHASYLLTDGVADPLEVVPEMSRRARGLPVWAALRSLGAAGVSAQVERLAQCAREIADGLAEIDGAVILNDVVYTQVCVSFGSDARTRAITAAVMADGDTWMSGSRWRDRDVLRVSVSNWSTSPEDITAAVESVRRVADRVDRSDSLRLGEVTAPHADRQK